jgi:hypothetical protein
MRRAICLVAAACLLFGAIRLTAHPTGTASDGTAVFHSTTGGGLWSAASGYLFTNYGASGAITYTLPAAARGMIFRFGVASAQTLKVDPQNDDQIIGLTDVQGDKIASDMTIGTAITLVALDSTNWLPIPSRGTWTDDN